MRNKLKKVLVLIWALIMLAILCLFLFLSWFFVKTALSDNSLVWNIKVIGILMPVMLLSVWFVLIKGSMLDEKIKNLFHIGQQK